MGEHEGRAQPNGLLPNGVLANEATSVIGVIDSERWLKAEERTAELIACIQPNQPSEDLRNAIADYVQRLITKCFPCQVFTFGSVPLKTYLPDGDIDLTTFSKNENVKETWANLVRDTLENEEKDENAEFRVKEVQFIQAEVKIIKCLVENIVVDISFNQLGGLCTLCFLEEVDHLINHNHLFKRSIILIKAWCYYESRILGAHHGLISTYALETLVLYIFHIFNNSFAGPLEVLYRFLQFFSKFDWESFCVSLGGPVPIRLLPEVTAEPPWKDGGEMLLSKIFLDACSSVYAVFPGGLDNPGQPFVSKHFNVIDPLRINNNLGRSVSRGNFYRIRSAFAFGAKKLSRLLDCTKEEVHSEVNHFFMNTWDRHGGGNRPDTPRDDLRLRLSKKSDLHKFENLENRPSSKILKEHLHNTEIDMNETSCTVSPQYGDSPLESQSKLSKMTPDVRPDQGVHLDKGQRSLEVNNLVNNVEGINPFVRTRSSPELTDSYVDISSRGRHNRTAESGKIQISAAGFDAIRKNLGPEVFANKKTQSSVDDPSYVKHISHQNIDDKAEAVSTSNSYHNNSRATVLGEEPAPVVGTQGMLQEKQDLVNMMASYIGPRFNGQAHMPMNMASPHFPLPFSQTILTSMGYAQRNFAGMLPTDFPFIDHPWASSMQFPPGMAPSPMTYNYPGMGMTSIHDDLIETDIEKYAAVELRSEEGGNDVWQENDRDYNSSFDLNNGSVEMNHLDTQMPSTSAGTNSSSSCNPGHHSKDQMKLTRENRGSGGENQLDIVQLQSMGNRRSDAHSDERTASPRFFRTSSSKSKTSSENSWDGSSIKVSKLVKEQRGRKSAISEGSDVHENLSHQGDVYDRDWDSLSNNSYEIAESSTGSHAVPSLNDQSHHNLSLELAHTSVSDTMVSVPPMLLGLGSRPRAMDNFGAVPLRFYPTGPPVPFITMLPPHYNFSPETLSRLGGEDGFDSSASGQNVSSSDGLDKSKLSYISSSMRRVGSAEANEQHKCDILNSDFSSHWQNLQFGRFCQNPRSQVPLLYPSPVTVPPMYLQGHFPWDGPGRPLSTNMNVFPPNYGPRIVPAASLQTLSNRPNVYQRYVDEMPRYRSGTGTYLPNPKVSVGDRHPLGTRRGNYSYEQSGDNHGDRNDREGNWNTNSKTRAAGRNHSRNQAERSSSRMDRLAASESRADRPWTSNKPDVFHSYQSQNGLLRSNSTQGGSSNVAYGMYPVQTMNPNGMSSNGPTVMMLYPYDQNAHYGWLAEQLEIGSLGPVDFSGMNQSSHFSEVSQSSEALEEQQFHSNSVQQSSSDQPSSPHAARKR